MPFNITMIKNEISEQDYLNHLIQQRALFSTLEERKLPCVVLLRAEEVNRAYDYIFDIFDELEQLSQNTMI